MGYWEVQLGGQWKSLGRVVGQACNDAQSRGATQIKFEAHGHSYVIDMNQMTQTNVKSGKSRPVRCKGKDHGHHGGGGSHSVTVHVPSAPPAPPADPPAAKPVDSGMGAGAKIAVGGGILAGAAAIATGAAVAAGVLDIGDITDAATAAGDAIADVAGDAADAIADAAADVADLS